MLKATKPLPTTDQLKQASADAWADRYRRFEADMAQEHAKAPTPAKPDTSAILVYGQLCGEAQDCRPGLFFFLGVAPRARKTMCLLPAIIHRTPACS